MNRYGRHRIWELDALRGISILGMIILHTLFDLKYFWSVNLRFPPWVMVLSQLFQILFILISGICATLSSNSLKRGIFVFGCGLLVSYGTIFGEVFLGLKGIRIWFGILHMLGISMMLYSPLQKLPVRLLTLISLSFASLGFWFDTISVSVPWLFPLGLRSDTVYVGSDYFPLFPYLGWFLMGSALGKYLYKNQQSLFHRIRGTALPIRMLSFMGRHSLMIYLLHQPLILALGYLILT